MLKKTIFFILGFIALLLIVAAFVKKDFSVEKTIVIQKPEAEVFNYIKYLKNQDNFSVWAKIDSDMKKTYTGTDGTVGFIAAWDSDNADAGKGEQEIIKIDEGNRIDYELRFIKPFEATDYAYMTTKTQDSTATEVQWGFRGKMNYPMNLMLLFVDMEKMLGDDLQKGLESLKDILEK